MTTNDSIEIFKSLLQKAVRRGNIEMVSHAVRFLTQHDLPWLRNRLAVLTFEECWTYGEEVSFENSPEIVSQQTLKLATAIKNRNAAGLGSLAFYLNAGDTSIFEGTRVDDDLKVVADGFKNPGAYWNGLAGQNLTKQQNIIVSNARNGFDMAVFPWDKCFMLAAGYLAISAEIPSTTFSKPSTQEFPLWIAIDKHTPVGHSAICTAARRIGFDEEKAQWLVFYMEGAKCNQIVDSPWWEREVDWRLRQLELTTSEAEKLWLELRPVLIDELKYFTEELRILIGK